MGIKKFCIKNKFLIATFVLMFMAFSGALGMNSGTTFDTFSNNVIVSDLIYNQIYDDSPNFIQIYGDCITEDYNKAFYSQSIIDKTEFNSYYSSILLHGKVYRLLNKILPFNGEIKLHIFYFFNIFIISIFLSYIINWLKKITNKKSAFALLLILAFFSPNLLSLGQNLYWVGWTLYLPFVAMICFVQSKFIASSKNNIYSFLIALACCSIKLLCYYEFTSTIMIAMMIPLVYYYLVNEFKMKDIMIKSIYPAVGAIFSFFLVSIYKVILLIYDLGDISLAKKQFIEPIIYRILGSKNDSVDIINLSANIDVLEVVNMYLNETAFTLFKALNISFRDIIIITILVMSVAHKVLGRKDIAKELKLKVRALMVCTVLSLFSSISWFILGKPHAYIHISQCITNWYLPFVLFAIIFNAYIVFFIAFKEDL